MDENKTVEAKLPEALKGIWDSLTEEQKEKANACQSMDELLKLAAEEGIELPDEMLDAVAGGYIYKNAKGYWESIDDRNGKVLMVDTKEEARDYALSRGFSGKEISFDELQKLRNPKRSPFTIC